MNCEGPRIMQLMTLSVWMCLLTVTSGLDTSQPLTVLTIGAIDYGNTSQPTSLQIINSTAAWGGRLEIKILWSIASLKEKFALLKEVRGLIDTPVDFLVLNDVFYGSLKKKHKFDLLDTSVVHFQANLSPFASPVPAKIWPAVNLPPMCGNTNTNRKTYVDGSLCNDNVDLDPDNDVIVPSKIDVVFAVLGTLKWDSLIILYEDQTALDTKDLSARLTALNTKHQVYHVPQYANTVGLHQLLTAIYNITVNSYNDDVHLVLLCSDACVSAVINESSDFDEINGKKTAFKLVSKWLIVLPTPNTANVEQCGMDMDNIAVITYPPTVPNRIYNMSTGLPKTVEEVLFVVGSDNDTSNVTEADIKQNASETFARVLRSQSTCWKSEVSTLLWKPGGVRLLSPVGYVNRSGQLIIYDKVEIYPNIKFGFNKRMFNVSTLQWDPYVKITNTTEQFEGFCIDLLNEMAASLNFTYTIGSPADGEWGEIINGSFTGLIGQLEREDVDLIVGPVSIQPEREMVMDFIFPFFTDYTTVLIKKPDPNRTKWRTFIDPFKWEVLMCIGIALVLVTIFYFLVERWNPFYEGKKPQNSMFGDAFWYMYGALLTQGGEHLPDSQAGRTVVSCWWLFSIVMAATYSGNLIAFLTVNKDKLPFDTLDGLVQQTDYKWGTTGGTYWKQLFKTSNQTNYRLVWEGIEKFKQSDSRVLSFDPLVHLNKVNEGSYGFIADRSMMEKFLAKSCDLAMIKENFLPLQYAIGLPNNSAYNKIFSEEMLTIYESGLLQIWKKRWWPKNRFCKGSLTTEAKKITLIDVQSAFYLIGIGVVIAGIALSFEWLVRFVKNRRNAKPKHVVTSNGHANGHLPQYVNGMNVINGIK